MFLGHEKSNPDNVHARVGALGIPLVHYPPQDVVRKYDALCAPHHVPPDDAQAVFVAQVPNMMSMSYLAWAIDTITGQYVMVGLKHARKSGCAMAFVRPEALPLVLRKSRSILFDVHGLWKPDTEKQLNDLHRYCSELRAGEFPEVHADGRVPRGCIFFEEMGVKPKGVVQQTRRHNDSVGAGASWTTQNAGQPIGPYHPSSGNPMVAGANPYNPAYSGPPYAPPSFYGQYGHYPHPGQYSQHGNYAHPGYYDPAAAGYYPGHFLQNGDGHWAPPY